MKKAALTATLLIAAGTTHAQFYAIPQGRIDGISNNGIGSGSTLGNGEYFMWTPGTGAFGIGGVTPGDGVGGQGKISNDGRYISGTTFNAAENYHEMSRYDTTTGTWTGFGVLPTIGTQIDAEVTSGWAISGNGQHIVGLGWTSLGTADAHATQWTEGVGMFSLGSNQIGRSSRANGVNFDGTVVGGWQDGDNRQGAVWVNGVQELITTNDGFGAAEVFEVSDDGRFAVGMGFGDFFTPGNAYRYDIENNAYEALPNLAEGGQQIMGAAAVNGDGTLIGGGTWGFGPAFFGNGFIWEEGVGTMTVSEYLDSKGVAYPAGFNFAFVTSISTDGQWLAGWGGFGSAESWVVHIPAPGSLTLLGLGGAAMIRRRR